MEKLKVLVIEDEVKVAAFIHKGLTENGYDVDVAYDGEIGSRMASAIDYDAVLLDVNLPMENGFEVCRKLRIKNSKVPIIMLTAMSATEDKLKGFEYGADDYLVKPFNFLELLARLKAVRNRRTGDLGSGTVLKYEDLELDNGAKQVRRGGTLIELTAKEFQLMEFLMLNKQIVVSRAQIAEQVWDLSFDTGTNVIDVYISFLRNKIDKDHEVKLIQTVVGMGYVLRATK